MCVLNAFACYIRICSSPENILPTDFQLIYEPISYLRSVQFSEMIKVWVSSVRTLRSADTLLETVTRIQTGLRWRLAPVAGPVDPPSGTHHRQICHCLSKLSVNEKPTISPTAPSTRNVNYTSVVTALYKSYYYVVSNRIITKPVKFQGRRLKRNSRRVRR